MSSPRRTMRLTTVSLAFGLVAGWGLAPAFADGTRDKVLAITKQAMEANGAKSVTWGKVDGDDARFTVSDVRAVTENEGKAGTLAVTTSTYVGAKPTPEGGYSADQIVLDGFSLTTDESKVAASHIVLTKYVGQPPAKIKPGNLSGEKLERAEATGITITTEDGKTVPIASFAIASSDYVGDTPRNGSLDLKGLVIPLDPKDEETAQIRELGYDKVSLDIAASGTWDDKTGRLDVPALTVSAGGMGTLKLAMTLGGLTPAVLAELRKSEQDQAKQMELLQSLSVERASIRWEDASLAGRILAQQAKAQGTDAKTYAKQLKLMLPPLLSMIGNKDFEKKVASAAGAFLEQPKSLTIAARPKQPLPFAQIMGAAMMAPQSLPTVVGAEVSAND